ncbi:PTS sugar transporter subunit IIB [Streptococcus panodentis]|uniref:PTS sugar transporter subunit IIB n=1 Tax=Streptococcus panodentis TaxID=1581472 RepID=A0ABS5AZA5_9STRE|nr:MULTISPECIES: PTS sugar transporter subunit IIB [Streptococcus]KXT83387.1 PTS system, cellobiose-specific IIB component [Streptococcus sp. DD11]MBP2621929.1 PTS sugar transporter subunit IIB [Streptococcus panodentis]
MEAKQIMLVCAAGMSTSLMVNKMQKAAEDRGLAARIFAVPVPEAAEYLANEQVDVLLLGPQVRYLLDDFKEKTAEKGIPVEVIPMTDYGMMKGDKVLDLAESLIG